MKKTISFLILLFATYISVAQTVDEQKFIGTWKYSGSNTQFTLMLKYGQVPNGYNALLAFHRLIRNDSVVQNAMPLLPEYGDYTTASGGAVLIPGDASRAKGGITDAELSKPGKIVLTYISPTKIRFQLFQVSGPQKNNGASFRLPYDVVLVKQ